MSPGHCWCGSIVGYVAGVAHCFGSPFHDPESTGEPEVVRSLYLAGPMSGLPGNNYAQFNTEARHLREYGFEVVNPAEFGAESQAAASYVDLLREDLRRMLGCDGVAFLDRWWVSTGARHEIHVAGLLRMPVRSVSDWILRPPPPLGSIPQPDNEK